MDLDSPTAEEFAFIFDSWASSFKKSPYAGCITNDMYPEVSRRTMQDIVDRGARLRVAYAQPDDGDRRVMGYSVSEPGKRILHYLYVKRDFRGMGIGTGLLNDVLTATESGDLAWTYTHRTKASPGFLGKLFQWNPVSARVKSTN